MATLEQCDELQSVCGDFLKLESNKQEYYERPEWGVLSFRGVAPHLDTVFWLAKELRTLPSDRIAVIPDNNVVSSTNLFSEIMRDLQRINDFKILQDNATSIHSKYYNSLRTNSENLFGTIIPWISLSWMTDDKHKRLAKAIDETNDKAINNLDETMEYVQNAKNTIDSVLQVARAESGEAGAAEFTKQFIAEAGVAKTRAICWLFPTVFFVMAAFALSMLFMFGVFIEFSADPAENSSTSTLEIAYGIGGRVIGITVLFYAAMWSGKIALANMHLSSVNKHRAISLETLQAFQNAVDDPTARDAVVLEAARAVYENVPSGYIGRQTSEQAGGGRILELIRSSRPQTGQQEGGG